MLGLGEVRCGAERVTCAFTRENLSSLLLRQVIYNRMALISMKVGHVLHAWPDNGCSLCGGIVVVVGSCNFAGLGVIVAYPAVAFSCLSAPTVDCSLPSEGLLLHELAGCHLISFAFVQ